MNTKQAKQRLEKIRLSIENQNISYGEIFELASLVKYIDKNDVELLQWAGLPEIEINY